MDESVNTLAARNAYEAKRGAIAILPLALGASVYGLAFGFLAVQVGFPWWGVAIMSASTHAGSSQIIAVEQFASTGVVLGAVLPVRHSTCAMSASSPLYPRCWPACR